ncbi:MAG TPA: sodium:solute symporter [Tepidisphaeraceae bacterium]|nr:sodium:solute symporter [Tepidisphaeraceae bacterium]
MQSLDWMTLGLYFVALLGVTWWSLLKPKSSATGYFLAGKDVGWFAIGCSLFASNIGSEHLVGLAGQGAKVGVAPAHYELHAWCLLVLGWVMVPFYERSMVFTMPEFLEKRYNPAARWFLSVISLVAYVLTKLAVGLTAGGVVFKALFPNNFIADVDNFWVGAVGVVLVTGVYTVLGGLRAVVYTEVIQTLVFVLGSALLLIIGLWKVGGWDVLRQTCGSEHFNLWKPNDHPDFPWFGMLVGAPIVGLWYWTTDQYMVQRTLAARNQTEARRGTIFAAYMKMLPLWLFIVPGMIAFALATQGKMSATVLKDTDQAFPLLVKEVLPIGIRGVVAGGLLAALMSSLASCFNSSSTLFTMDIYRKIHPTASDTTLVWVGRVATVVMVVLGLAWIPLMDRAKGLYTYLQAVQTYIAPPIFAVFFLGVFFKRINGYGCMVGMVGGFCLGMLRLVADILKERGKLAPDSLLYQYADINFAKMGIVFFAAATVMIVVASLLTPKPSEDKLVGLTYGTITASQRAETRASWNKWDVIATAGVLVLILSTYAYFVG